MKLNPLDIRRQQFARKTFGGYDTEEVDGFLKQLADQWEDVLDDLRTATDRAQETENKLRHYERVEMALQEALESTRESGRRAEALADQKARLILDEAEMRARQIVQDAERDRHGLRQDLVTLTSRQAEIGARLRGFLLSELEILAQFQGDDPVGFIKLQPADRPAEQRSLDGPVEPSRLVQHDAGYRDATPDAPRASERSTPEAAPAPPYTEPVAPEPVASEPAAPEPVAAEPAPISTEPSASEPVYSEPGAPAAARPEPVAPEPAEPEPSAPEPSTSWTASAPPSWDEELADAAPASWTDAPPAPPTSAPTWPPTPTPAPPPATGIPTWAADLPEASPAEPATPSWDLRSLVTGSDDNVAGSEAERERIRRILDDLD